MYTIMLFGTGIYWKFGEMYVYLAILLERTEVIDYLVVDICQKQLCFASLLWT